MTAEERQEELYLNTNTKLKLEELHLLEWRLWDLMKPEIKLRGAQQTARSTWGELAVKHQRCDFSI